MGVSLVMVCVGAGAIAFHPIFAISAAIWVGVVAHTGCDYMQVENARRKLQGEIDAVAAPGGQRDSRWLPSVRNRQ